VTARAARCGDDPHTTIPATVEKFVVQVWESDRWMQLTAPYPTLADARDRVAKSAGRLPEMWELRIVRVSTSYEVVV
jgi:hypothetical protein